MIPSCLSIIDLGYSRPRNSTHKTVPRIHSRFVQAAGTWLPKKEKREDRALHPWEVGSTYPDLGWDNSSSIASNPTSSESSGFTKLHTRFPADWELS